VIFVSHSANFRRREHNEEASVAFACPEIRSTNEDNMATTVADLSELLKGIPAGAWVAISERQNKTLAYGVDAQAVFSEAQQKGEELPLMVRVPDQNMAMFL
jgi:hypothetical protein